MIKFAKRWRKLLAALLPGKGRRIGEYIDAKYYLTTYRDVAARGVDPVTHFMAHGWREGRNPNRWFNTKYYLKQHTDVRDAGINPLVHYIRYGMRERRECAPHPLDRSAQITTLFNGPGRICQGSTSQVTIVVPIFNAFDDLAALLQNFDETVAREAPIIFVDDCSTDQRITPLLQKWVARHDAWTAIRNASNSGFAATVNRGIELSSGDIVIVNTDVLLPQNWLVRLLAPIRNDVESVASVTPFSNNSSLTGYLQPSQESELHHDESLQAIDDAFASLPSIAIDIASGVGFCMAINRKALERVGLFDAKTYQGGYFEDTDWCQRVSLAGFRNVATSNLFVYHKTGSGSFGMDRRELYSAQNRSKFLERYAFYADLAAAFVRDDPLLEIRHVAQAVMWRRRASGAVLLIDHVWGGGSRIYSDQLRREMLAQGKFVVYLLIDPTILDLRFCFQSEEVACQGEFNRDIWKLGEFFDIDKIIVNGIQSTNRVRDVLLSLIELSSKKKIILNIHDYMCICPSIFLLNVDNSYCHVPDISVCYECLLSNSNTLFGTVNQTEWRRMWGRFLAHVTEIRVFSESSRDILLRAYPDLAITSNIEIVDPNYEPPFIISHGDEPPLRATEGAGWLGGSNRLRVGIMGSMYVHKGSGLVAELARFVMEQHLPVDITLFGQWRDKSAPKNIEYTGYYDVRNIARIVRSKRIQVILFPSVCPETYGYTLSEIFRMQLPVVALNIGAQGDRAGRYRWGVVIDDSSPSAVYEALKHAHALQDIRKS